MRMSIKPASRLLVGVLFICILCDSASAEQSLKNVDPFNEHESRSLYSIHREASSGWGELKVGEDSVYFPWHRSSSHMIPSISSSSSSSVSTPAKSEEVLMNCSNTVATVEDLSAMNSQRQMDLSYRDSQNGDPRYLGLSNSLGISVSGRRDEGSSSGFSENLSDILDTFSGELAASNEAVDDSAIPTDGIGDLSRLGNHLSIDVHGIYVSAVNTVPGGNAVATSNIVIEPVQIIVCPSEVEEKLK